MKTRSNKLSKADIDEALTSPIKVFDYPMEVISADGLTGAERIEILKRWELDARALQRAADESMVGGADESTVGGESPVLDEVNKALSILDPEASTPDGFGKVPTKI